MEDSCPLCMEELDATDFLLASRLCQCHYAVCLWCFRRICEDAAKDDTPARCPNCRAVYDQERIRRQQLDPEQLEEIKKKKPVKEDKKKPITPVRIRKDLANVRVVQRNLVYVVGLPMEICYEETLKSAEYIGQFGKIMKISVSRSGPYGSLAAKNGPSGSAYVTFRRAEDARRCIETIHGMNWEGKLVKACYGTTKYCNAFLKGLPCNNSDCLYLHEVADDEDSYTKEETKSTKFVNLVHAASLNQANGVANGNPHQRAGSTDLSAAVAAIEATQSLPEPAQETQRGPDEDTSGKAAWPSLAESSFTWASRAGSGSVPAQPAQPMPPAEDAQAWPELPGGPAPAGGANPGSSNGGSAVASEGESDAPPSKPPLAKTTTTMAAQIARASSTPAVAPPPAKKKLTPLNGRTTLKAAITSPVQPPAQARQKQAPNAKADEDAGGKGVGSQELQGMPQMPPLPQKGSLPAAGEEVGWKVEATGTSRLEQDAGLGANTSGSRAAQQQPAGPSPRGPPGFVQPAKDPSRPKVQPPPGFGTAAIHEPRSSSPYQSFGSESSTSSPAPGNQRIAPHIPAEPAPWDPLASSQPSSLHSIWSSGSLDTAGMPVRGSLDAFASSQPAPRSRSRFHFANTDDETPQPPLGYEQPRMLEAHQMLNGFPGSYGGQLHGSSGYASNGTIPSSSEWARAFGIQQSYPAPVAPAQHQQGTEPQQLPAGLALLRKLQAQGGVRQQARSHSAAPQAQLGQDEAGGAERSWLDNFGRVSDAALAQAPSKPGQPPPPASSQPSRLGGQAAPGKQRQDAPQAAGNGTPGQTAPKTPPRRKGKKANGNGV